VNRIDFKGGFHRHR